MGRDVSARSRPSLARPRRRWRPRPGRGRGQRHLRLLREHRQRDGRGILARSGAANPLDGHDVGDRSAPAFGDLDGDGDLDLVAGEYFGTFAYFENTGSATSPAFTPRTGAANPLDGQDVGYGAVPALGDLDGDGDLDLVAGESTAAFPTSRIRAARRARCSPARTGAANPLDEYNFHGNAAPAIGDIDGDGDLDVVGGNSEGNFFGSRTPAARRARPSSCALGAANPFDGQDVGSHAAPAAGDLDGDGDPDLVAGAISGAFAYYEHPAAASSRAPAPPTRSTRRTWGLIASPALRDLDGDGDLDLVAGEYFGTFAYFENTGSATSPALHPRTGSRTRSTAAIPDTARRPRSATSTATATSIWSRARLRRLQLLREHRQRDEPGRSSAAHGRRESARRPERGESLDARARRPRRRRRPRPGRGRGPGAFAYFENTGTAASSGLHRAHGRANPLDGQGRRYSTPSLADLDRDGDLDLVAGESLGTFAYYENTGGATSPVFTLRTGRANPLAGQDLGTDTETGARRPRRRRRPRPGRGRDRRHLQLFREPHPAAAAGARARGRQPAQRPERRLLLGALARRPRRRRRPRPRRRRQRRHASPPSGTRAAQRARPSRRSRAPPTRSTARAWGPARTPRSAISTATATSIWSRERRSAPSSTSRTPAARRARPSRRSRAPPTRSPARTSWTSRLPRSATSTATAISTSSPARATAASSPSRTSAARRARSSLRTWRRQSARRAERRNSLGACARRLRRRR